MEYQFTFTQQEVQFLLNALGELPLKHAAPLFNKISMGAKKQEEENAIPIDAIVAQVQSTP